MTILPYTDGQRMPSAPIIFYLLSVIFLCYHGIQVPDN